MGRKDPGRHPGERDLTAVTGQVTADLLHRSHLMRPDDVADALTQAARPLGVSAADVYLADLQQHYLVPVPAWDGPATGELPINATLAGHAFVTITVQSEPAGEAGEAHRVWIPLMDGTERLGVLSLTVADAGEAMLDQYRTLASLIALMVVAKSGYSDTFAQVRRRRPMALQGELVWGTLPPLTFATGPVVLSALLEPAYEAAGDAFDYSILGDHLHISIFDALGHDLSAGLLTSVGMASCRSTRRSGGSLADMATRADDAIAGFFGGDRFVTALLCDLDLDRGLFTWIPCGHPSPLLIRGQTVRELPRVARPPLGLAGLHAHQGQGTRDSTAFAPPRAERLEPGDQILLYTDGVTEGRGEDGTPFGVERLADFIRHDSMGLPPPERMRRLTHEILDYQQGRPRDDATAVLIEWRPARPGLRLTP